VLKRLAFNISKRLFFLMILFNNISKIYTNSTFYDIIRNVLTDIYLNHDIVIPSNHCEYLAIRDEIISKKELFLYENKS